MTGGVERGTVDVAQALVRAGWRALVASAGGPMVRELERAGAEHITLPLATKNPWAMRANVARLSEVIRAQNVSIVHGRSRAPAWSAREAAAKTGVPFVTTFHAIYGAGPFGLKKLYNRVMTEGELVIAISNFTRDHILSAYAVPAERIRVIHRGVDVQFLNPTTVTPTRLIQLTSKWRLPVTAPVIMLPGRLTSWKGHDVLIDALAELKHRGGGTLDIRCLMVGQDQGRSRYRASIENYATTRGVEGNVQVIDDCGDLAAAYMATDVVVSASTRPEAFGRVVAEGQAMGRPVVAPAHGAAPEIIVPGVTGWLFTPSDPVSLADALTRAINLSKDERARIADIAIKRVRELFNKTDMCAKTVAVYDEVLARRAPRS
ncbi:MAG: glycosyltransferase [Rhodospirillaceae bacterium]|nr:glycosyltransferase [Rhodospirillaceae bacterium]